MDEPTEPLAARRFPGLRFARPMPGSTATIDTSAARAALGWSPQQAWRTYPNPEASDT